MVNFEPIVDASRLQVGDLIVIPSEKSRKQKRLHVSHDTYRKMGLSSGFTGRSVNATEAVERLLRRDDGCPRVVFISSVNLPYMSSRDAALMALAGNSLNDTPQVPVISDARFSELPFECPAEDSKFVSLFYANTMSDGYATALLEGKAKGLLFFSRCTRWGGSAPSPDDALTEAYESRCGSGGCISNLVPTLENGSLIEDEPMDRREIVHFTTESKSFNHSNQETYAERCNYSISAPKKFFEAIARRGAAFYRPSRAFLATVEARALAKAFADYVANAKKVMDGAKLFEGRLSGGIKSCRRKIALAERIMRDLEREGNSKKMIEQFKEIIR